MLSQLFLSLFISFSSIYNYTIPSVEGKDINFANFSGKKILIVNIASGSRYSWQLQKLDSLQIQHEDHLVIVAVPSSSFGNEPLDNDRLNFVLSQFHFKIAANAAVIGSNQIPLYNWLTNQKENEMFDSSVKEDFQKYLVDETGRLIGIFTSTVDPLGVELSHALSSKPQ